MAKYRSAAPSPGLPRRTLQYLEHGAPKGQRNAELFDAACQFRDAGHSADVTETRLLARALADGLQEGEAATTIRSAFTRTAREPVGGTVHPAPGGSPPAASMPALPPPIEGGFLRLLAVCFREGEHVAVAPAAESDDGEPVPRRGVTMTVAEWRQRVAERGGIDRVFGTKLGLFTRINPMTKGGARNEDVTSFRHALVEFDRDGSGSPIPREDQYRAIVASGLPVSVLIDSGNKSLHAWIRVDAPDAAEYARRVEVIWKWFEGMHLDRQNRNPSRLSRCPDGWRTVDGEPRQQRLLATGLGAGSWAAWEEEHGDSGLPAIVPGDRFMAVPVEEPEQLVAGVLHRGAKMVIGGPSKARKSWSLLDLMLSVASGAPWWGFPTRRGRALYLNFELPSFALQYRLRVIAAAKGIPAFAGFDVWNLRGHATDFSALIPKILDRIRDTGYAMILIDPVYKGLGNRSENDAGDIASLLNEIEQLAVRSGAAVVFGAHFSKGNQSGKDAIDRIGGSGVFARDPDVILTMTPHEDEGAHAIDITLRALPPVQPFVVRWEDAVFTADRDADPSKLRSADPSSGKQAENRSGYRVGTAAGKYGPLVEDMPPMTNGREPEYSAAISYIRQKLTETEGGCSLEEARRIFYCLANMKHGSPLVFDRASRTWRGRRFRG